MPLDPNARSVEAERAELERVAEALARSPRLSRLLRYMGEKLFSGEVDQLNEYNIATEVLGRSKTVFNAGEDAIAQGRDSPASKAPRGVLRERGKKSSDPGDSSGGNLCSGFHSQACGRTFANFAESSADI